METWLCGTFGDMYLTPITGRRLSAEGMVRDVYKDTAWLNIRTLYMSLVES